MPPISDYQNLAFSVATWKRDGLPQSDSMHDAPPSPPPSPLSRLSPQLAQPRPARVRSRPPWQLVRSPTTLAFVLWAARWGKDSKGRSCAGMAVSNRRRRAIVSELSVMAQCTQTVCRGLAWLLCAFDATCVRRVRAWSNTELQGHVLWYNWYVCGVVWENSGA